MVKLNGLLKSEVPVLVIFFATWCPHCQRMEPIWNDLERKEGKKLRVERYDIDAPENVKLIEYYKVTSIPTMLLFRDGDQVWRQSGEMAEAELAEVVNRFERQE